MPPALPPPPAPRNTAGPHLCSLHAAEDPLTCSVGSIFALSSSAACAAALASLVLPRTPHAASPDSRVSCPALRLQIKALKNLCGSIAVGQRCSFHVSAPSQIWQDLSPCAKVARAACSFLLGVLSWSREQFCPMSSSWFLGSLAALEHVYVLLQPKQPLGAPAHRASVREDNKGGKSDSAGTSNDKNANGCKPEVMMQAVSTVASCSRALSHQSCLVLLCFCRLK